VIIRRDTNSNAFRARTHDETREKRNTLFEVSFDTIRINILCILVEYYLILVAYAPPVLLFFAGV